MTISSLVRIVGPIIGNGSFSAFPFTFKIFATSELTLIATDSGVDRAPLVLGIDYSVVLNTDQNAAPGGTITYRVAGTITDIPVNTTLNGTSNVSNLQPINLTNNGGFFPAVINAGLDRLTILVQQIARIVGVSLQFPVSDGTISGILPNKVTRALKLLGFDVNGAPVVSTLTIAQIEAIASAGTNANMFYGAATTGTGDALVAAVGLPATGYAPGQVFNILTSAANTLVNPTANFGGGIRNIKRIVNNGKANLVNTGEYFNGYIAKFIYDGTDLVLTNPWLLVAGMASIATGNDLTGTDPVNTYGQVDMYLPNSLQGVVGSSALNGPSISTSRGTGTVPTISLANDLLGGTSMYAYSGVIAGYNCHAAVVGRVTGATAANLGGALEFYTKADNGILILRGTWDNTGIMTFVSSPGVPTPNPGDNTTKVANTAFVAAALASISSKQIQPVAATVAASALTVSLNPTSLDFRATPVTSGTINTRTVGAAVSLVVPSTATLGTISAVPSRLVLVAVDNAGTVELAIVNLAGGNNLDETTLINTTAISAAATASNVFYSTTARTGVPFRVVGYVESTQATAGTWATAPSTIQGAGGNAIAAMSSIGYGQTWQSVTRNSGTTYYNTTGKPIMISVYYTGTAASGLLTIGGVVIANASNQGTGQIIGYSAVIPPGASYGLSGVAGTQNVTELR